MQVLRLPGVPRDPVTETRTGLLTRVWTSWFQTLINKVNAVQASEGTINIRDYGALGDGITDDTAAIQGAIDAALALQTGGTVYFPAGVYCVTHLDLHNESNATPTQSVTLAGDGHFASVLTGASSGNILIDAIGRSYLTIKDLRLTTNGTAVYQTALLLARRTGGAIECRSNIFTNLRIDGEYSIASVVSLASEINNWTDCEFLNDDATNGYCCFFTGLDNDIAAVSSTHGTVLASTNTYVLMTHCTWFTPYDSATPVIMDQGAAYTLVACTVQVGDQDHVRCVTYIDRGAGAGGGFKGPVVWIAPLWECYGADTIVHYLATQTVALGYYSGLYDTSGTMMSGTGVSTYAVKTNGTAAALLSSRIQDSRFVGGVGGTFLAAVDQAVSATLDLWTPEFDTTITIATSWAGCYFRAQTVTAPAETTPYPGHPITVVE